MGRDLKGMPGLKDNNKRETKLVFKRVWALFKQQR
jgi:hypothetical protein